MLTRIALPAVIATLALLLSGCETSSQTRPDEAIPDRAHNSRNALDWAGSYHGVLPCADCEGIETVVTLRQDGRYQLETRYLGVGYNHFLNTGRFFWSEDGGRVTLHADQEEHYRVGENRLIRLDTEGQAIQGALAPHYVLNKMTDRLVDVHWQLAELQGEPLTTLETLPWLQLHGDRGTVSGHGGCNSFTGPWQSGEEGSLDFGNLAATMMACPVGMDVEQRLFDVLARTHRYQLAAGQLQLLAEDGRVLARFDAIHLQPRATEPGRPSR